ncbi:MAG: type III pantothenate kinase [Cycloclasticus sp.]|nr:type III pantothenate kinase [Cycloclasticus sp.]
MKQLFIDRGNTALKWQLVEKGSLLNEGAFTNDVPLLGGLSILQSIELSAISVSSVGSDSFHHDLNTWSESQRQPLPVFIESTREACGVTNVYKEPQQLGADRWLAMLAAHNKYSGMLCVVDSGTALTMDFLQGNGKHMGGFIVPGSDLMKGCLLDNTQKIHLEKANNSGHLGKNTSEAVVFGIEQMLQIFVREKVAEIAAQYQQKISIVLTGGHAKSLLQGLGELIYIEKDLVLQGLRLISKSSV